MEISIHAAREGGDAVCGAGVRVAAISIHAAREGGDMFAFRFKCGHGFDFNPRRP